jgi:hypothetical protein
MKKQKPTAPKEGQETGPSVDENRKRFKAEAPISPHCTEEYDPRFLRYERAPDNERKGPTAGELLEKWKADHAKK